MKIVRTYSAGVFACDHIDRTGKEATLYNARRLWCWSGAASLSELAVRGTANPAGCKFPVAVASVWVADVVEVLDCTPEAAASINAVPEWTAHE